MLVMNWKGAMSRLDSRIRRVEAKLRPPLPPADAQIVATLISEGMDDAKARELWTEMMRDPEATLEILKSIDAERGQRSAMGG